MRKKALVSGTGHSGDMRLVRHCRYRKNLVELGESLYSSLRYLLSPAVVNYDDVVATSPFCIWNPEMDIMRRIRGIINVNTLKERLSQDQTPGFPRLVENIGFTRLPPAMIQG